MSQEVYPLDLFNCSDCGHVQLLDVVDPVLLFKDYVYVSGTSPVFVKHFEEYTTQILQDYAPAQGSLVVDIGSNDGTFLHFFKKVGMATLGIDPAIDIAALACERGIETWPHFFSPKLARKIVKSHGKAAVVAANNVFAHCDDLNEIVEGVRTILKPEGLFFFEVSYLLDVYEKQLFDIIYHEHLAYHSVKPLKRFFEANGMTLIDVQRVKTHGGSLRGIVQLESGTRKVSDSVEALSSIEENIGLYKSNTMVEFGSRIETLGKKLNALLRDIKSKGMNVAGFGAPAKATTLMHHFGIGSEFIDYIVDDSHLKHGLFSPGFHIPIVPTTTIYDKPPDFLIILAWNFAESIIKNHTRFHELGGRFIVPLPEVRIM